MRVRVKPCGKMPLSRRFRAASRQLSATLFRILGWASLRPVCCCVYKKSCSKSCIIQNLFLTLRRLNYLRMRFVITGENRLTHVREVISRDLTYAQAMAIMARERRKRQRAWLRLRAERLGPGELKIKFEEIDNESN